MAVLEFSSAIFDALDAILPNDERHLVRRVHVSQGWGKTYFVTVYGGTSEEDAGAALAGVIRTIVDGVMDGRRHVIRMVWAEPI